MQDWVDGELSFYTAQDQSLLPIQWLILLENKTLTCTNNAVNERGNNLWYEYCQ